MSELVPVRFTLTTLESGRQVVRSAQINVERGAYPTHLQMDVAGLVLLRIPLQVWDSETAEDDD